MGNNDMNIFAHLKKTRLAWFARFLAMLAAAFATTLVTMGAVANAVAFNIPRVENKVPDASDWGEGAGFRVEALVDPVVGAAQEDFSAARCRLGWNEQGVLFFIEVRDTTPHEAPDGWHGDSVHIFAGRAGAGRDRVYYLCNAVCPPDAEKPNIHYRRYRGERVEMDEPPSPHRYAVRRSESGYAVEVLVPWEALELAPEPGLELDVQVMIFDYSPQRARRAMRWAPCRIGPEPEELRRVRLAEKASPPVLVAAGCELLGANPGMLAARLRVVGDALLAGRSAAVKVVGDAERSDFEFRFGEAVDGWCEGFAAVTLASSGATNAGALSVALPDDGGRVAAPLKNALAELRERFWKLELECKPWVFAGETLPACGFKEPLLADMFSGFDYSVRVRYFDTDCKPVEKAERPGRYGAVADLTAFGETRRKFFILYRAPDAKALDWGNWWRETEGLRVRIDGLPDGLGVDKRLLSDDPGGVFGGELRWFLREQLDKEGLFANLLAGLAEMPEDAASGARPLRPSERVEARRRAYLYNLKRAVGENPEYPFLAWTPNDYDAEPERRYPLVVYLHGAGERGADLSVLKHDGPRAQEWLTDDQPFIMVSPQCPANDWWEPAAVIGLVDKICAEMRVDADRIYLTGVSMGGFGTCDAAASYPERFAALAPICGFGSAEDTAWYKDVPLWAFHGDADAIVTPDVTRKGIARLKELGGKNIRYTEYPGEGHGIAKMVYADRDFWAWLLEQCREP